MDGDAGARRVKETQSLRIEAAEFDPSFRSAERFSSSRHRAGSIVGRVRRRIGHSLRSVGSTKIEERDNAAGTA
jgi:hypothetical protein